MYGHDMFMLPHGKTQKNVDWGNTKHAAFGSANYTHQPRERMVTVSSELKYRN